MKARPEIPPAVSARQHEASDPEVSAWASANAGSGKTHVLTQRVIKLLLGGEDPAKILCITFTKAAAATMATRVFNTLAEWTTYDDAALDQAILNIGAAPDARTRKRARVRDSLDAGVAAVGGVVTWQGRRVLVVGLDLECCGDSPDSAAARS